MIAEERLTLAPTTDDIAKLALGVRDLWLLDASGPSAILHFQANGEAQLALYDTEAEQSQPRAAYSGKWSAEGYRRGQMAVTAALTDDQGRDLLLLIGYEPNELRERRRALIDRALALLRSG